SRGLRAGTAPVASQVGVSGAQAVRPVRSTWVPGPWPGQNRPVAMLVLAGPVVSGARVTPIAPACPPSQQPWFAPQGQLQGTQMPGATQFASVVHAVAALLLQWPGETQEPVVPPPVQSASVEPAVTRSPAQRGAQQVCPFPGCCPAGHCEARVPTPPVGRSRVTPVELVVVQAIPARGPRSQVPVPGLLGVPVAEHFGHGWVELPVRYTSEFSGTFVDDAPLLRSSVPLAAPLQVFSTQVVSVGSVGFGIGSGVPKLQPTSVQSGAALLTGGMVEVGPIVHIEPVQLSANRLVEPSGVGPSGTIEAPPPMLRPPQVRFLMSPVADCVLP